MRNRMLYVVLCCVLPLLLGVAVGTLVLQKPSSVQACPCAQRTDTPQWDSYHWTTPGSVYVKKDFTPAQNTAYSGSLTQAISDWNGAGTKVTFTEGTGTEQVTVKGDTSDKPPGNATCSVLGQADGTLISATIKLYDKNLIDSEKHRVHKQNSIGHELGHSVGLDDHSSDKGALLYETCASFHDCNISTPQTDDKNGVKKIYP